MEKKKGKKRPTLSIKERCDILQRIEDGVSARELAAEFKVTRQAINLIKKRSKHIENAKKVLESCDGDLDRKRYKGTEESHLDQKLFEWFKQCRSMGFDVSGPMLKKKALDYNKRLGGKENFVASDGWLNRFKKRHGIKHKKMEEEKSSANLGASEEFIIKMKNIRDVTGIDLDYIYNCDETELYWKAEPSRNFITKHGKQNEDRKKAKNRLTVLLCTNASGSHKLPLFIVGKSAQPRCLKGIKNLPAWYVHQESASMTCELMTKWYRSIFLPEVKKKHDLDNNQKLKVILLMDNAAYHPPAEQLDEICESSTIITLPSDVTSLIQPVNQGIIEKFKRCYKKRFLEKLVVEDEFRNSKIFLDSFNLLDCFHFCKSAWNEVTSSNIRNCWEALLPLEDDCSSSLNVDLIDTKAFHALLTKIPAYQNLSIENINNWLDADSEHVSWKRRTDEETNSKQDPDDTAQETVQELDDVVSYEDQNWTPTDSILDNSCPTYIEAFVGLNTFMKWYMKKGESSELSHQCFVNAHEELTKLVLSGKST